MIPRLTACLHLPPSPGCRGFAGRARSLAALEADLDAALSGGVDAVLLENENDKPHTLVVTPSQVAWLTFLALEARRRTTLPLGIGVQRIDWQASLAVAAAADLQMVRLDVFVDRVRMQGEDVEVDPARVRALRAELGADVALWTDVHVKHAELLSRGPLAAAVDRAIAEGAAAVLITSDQTGRPPALADLGEARDAAEGRVPVLVASGLDDENAATLRVHCDGAIVGTALKDGERVDRRRVEALVRAWRG